MMKATLLFVALQSEIRNPHSAIERPGRYRSRFCFLLPKRAATRRANPSSLTTVLKAAPLDAHGAGQLKGWYSGSYLGSPTVRDYKGKYAVNPNGTGHMSFTDNYGSALEYDFVIVKGGDEVLMSNTLNGDIQNVEMKRQ